MFEPAGLLCDFVFVLHVEGMHEETFGKAMPADDVFGAFLSLVG